MRIWMIALSMACAGSAAAQETRIAQAGHVPPPASIGQLDWLVGRWIGPGIGGAPSHESWLQPSGDTMVGTFVQEQADGGIQFTEHMYIVEQDGSLAVKLKHFNANLTGWEEKDDMLTFRLVGLEDCAAYFHALTYRCDGEGGLLVAVRMQSDSPELQELVFRFRRAGEGTGPARCPDATTTVDMNQCYASVLERADARRAEYLAAALERESERTELTAMIAASDAAFAVYRDAECGAVLQDWIDGTIRGVMTLSCQIDMTDRRTHTIWRNWLTNMDSTPPVLPEPGPTE